MKTAAGVFTTLALISAIIAMVVPDWSFAEAGLGFAVLAGCCYLVLLGRSLYRRY